MYAHAKNEPVPVKLGDSGRAVRREVWKAGASAYNPASDRFVFECSCELHDRRAELLDELGRDCVTTTGGMGQAVVHPLLRYVESTEKETRDRDDSRLTLESCIRLGRRLTPQSV